MEIKSEKIVKIIESIDRINNLMIILNQFCNSQEHIEELRTVSSLTKIIYQDTDLVKAYFINCKIIDENTLCLDDTE